MKSMTVTEFKAQALKAIAAVEASREPLVLTRRGKPVVEVQPFRQRDGGAEPGRLRHLLVFENDIVSPLGEEMWHASR